MHTPTTTIEDQPDGEVRDGPSPLPWICAQECCMHGTPNCGKRGGHMLKKWGVLLLGASLCAVVLIAGANAVTAPITTPSFDLASKAAVMKYLATHGIDTKKIVIQRGARNYAGPHCPGKGWTCTTSKRVVQI